MSSNFFQIADSGLKDHICRLIPYDLKSLIINSLVKVVTKNFTPRHKNKI